MKPEAGILDQDDEFEDFETEEWSYEEALPSLVAKIAPNDRGADPEKVLWKFDSNLDECDWDDHDNEKRFAVSLRAAILKKDRDDQSMDA